MILSDEEGRVLVQHDGVGADSYQSPCNPLNDTDGIEDDACKVHKEKDFISLLSCTPRECILTYSFVIGETIFFSLYD